MFVDMNGVERFERACYQASQIQARLDKDAALPEDGRHPKMSDNHRQSLKWLLKRLHSEVIPRYSNAASVARPALPADGGDPIEPRPVVPAPKCSKEPLSRVAPPQQQPPVAPTLLPRRKGTYFT